MILTGDDFAKTDELEGFVRPIAEPVLSDFCTNLTGIWQLDVDTVPSSSEAFGAFLRWVDSHEAVLCSWGDCDRRQLEIDCGQHRIERPALLDTLSQPQACVSGETRPSTLRVLTCATHDWA